MVIFYFVHVNCAIMAMLYTHSIGNQPQNTMVVFKMHDSVPSMRYSRVCNVLRLLRIWLIPTYRVYRLYDISGYTLCTLYDISGYTLCRLYVVNVQRANVKPAS